LRIPEETGSVLMKDSMDIPKEIMQGKDWEKVPSSGNWHMINKNGWKKCSIRILNAKW